MKSSTYICATELEDEIGVVMVACDLAKEAASRITDDGELQIYYASLALECLLSDDGPRVQ